MPIHKQMIVARALELLDEVGVDGLTMRLLAKALNVQAPTLYWHFASKQDLLDQMANEIVAPVAAAVDVSQEPRQTLASTALALRKALLARRDGAKVYAGSYVFGDHVLAMADAMLGALLRAGLYGQDATEKMFNLIYYVLGFTIEEQGFAERWTPDTDKEGLVRQFNEAAKGRFEALQQCRDAIFSSDFDHRFDLGVHTFLQSIDHDRGPHDGA